MTNSTTAVWRKSTFSNPNNNCVEVILLPDGGAAVRDSKQRDASPILQFTRSEWEAFIAGVNDGQFNSSPS
ncbi:DUF397 domain-containing protein [Kribbella sp. NPDC023972]|uniref:DUF397 domain-containing protein n=1 Tax=Kribbella sp. NPDC023972 TaxID=3154795 RepID=UPI0033D6C375